MTWSHLGALGFQSLGVNGDPRGTGGVSVRAVPFNWIAV